MGIRLAGGIIKNEEGEVLLLHRNTPSIRQWELPGGKIEENESPEHAAIRELREELGVKISIINFLGRKRFVENDFEMDYYWYECEVLEGIPRIMEAKFDSLEYFSKSKLYATRDKLSANMKNLLEIL